MLALSMKQPFGGKNMSHLIVRIFAIILVFVGVVLLIPSSLPYAGAEAGTYPVYEPAELSISAPLPLGEIAPYAPMESCFLEENKGYVDDTIAVHIETIRAYDTKVFLTYVQIADPSQLRCAPAKSGAFDQGKISKTASNADIIAKRVHAVLAINGDYFGDRKEGVIYRNGIKIRENDFEVFDALIIDTEGNFHILKAPTAAEVQELQAQGVEIMHSFSFGPGLIINGERQRDYNAGTMGGNKKKAQRQAICQIAPLTYLCVTTHGPEQSGSEGMTLVQFGDLLEALGVKDAYNLDGGSSTWLVLNNVKINHKSKRGIQDIIYFATGSTNEEK